MAAEPRRPDTPFWAEPRSIEGDRLTLSREESHHLTHVHRASPGTRFEAIDGEGVLYECVLESIAGRAAVARILERSYETGELDATIHLLVGIPDWGGIEAVVTHAVPLGVHSLDFVACERSGRGPLSPERLGRLRRLARAGLKQSRRTRLPEIRSTASLGSSVGGLPKQGARCFGDPAGGLWRDPVAAQRIVSLAVGPPGGYSDAERRLLLESGFIPISLGDNRLTTETASLALLCLARNSLGTKRLTEP